ncbi:Hypothetical protein CINCED_3A019324 [Cinara cedri]|uniref:Uncharacterized protein n=1 Tax=Cinara cedri TaxID=506608 RepID=A0A5E4MD28_9HEMI|nr:Hypothetical protein CINCED_3A019324 [Cinara cedri]
MDKPKYFGLKIRNSLREIDYNEYKKKKILVKTYNKVKRINYITKIRSNVVKYKSGNILFENEKVTERWKEYIDELFRGDEIEDYHIYFESEEDMNELGLEITREEFYKALKDLRDKKQQGWMKYQQKY